MPLNKEINRNLTNMLVNNFDSDVSSFNSWMIDTFDCSIGTGSDLLGQVQDDIVNNKHGLNSVSNLKDLQLTEHAFKANPKAWFIYSSGDSLGRPVSVTDVKNIKDVATDTKSDVDLLPNELDARQALKKLVA